MNDINTNTSRTIDISNGVIFSEGIESILSETSRKIEIINLSKNNGPVKIPVRISKNTLAVENLQNIIDLRTCQEKTFLKLEKIFILLANA